MAWHILSMSVFIGNIYFAVEIFTLRTVTKIPNSLCNSRLRDGRFHTNLDLRKYHGDEKLWPSGRVSLDFLFDQSWIMIGLDMERENKVRKVSTHWVERCSEPTPSGELRWKGEEEIREAGQPRTSGHCCRSLSASWQWTLPWLHGVWTSLSSGPCCLC